MLACCIQEDKYVLETYQYACNNWKIQMMTSEVKVCHSKFRTFRRISAYRDVAELELETRIRIPDRDFILFSGLQLDPNDIGRFHSFSQAAETTRSTTPRRRRARASSTTFNWCACERPGPIV